MKSNSCFNCNYTLYVNPNGLCNKCQNIYDRKLIKASKNRTMRKTLYPFGFEYNKEKK